MRRTEQPFTRRSHWLAKRVGKTARHAPVGHRCGVQLGSRAKSFAECSPALVHQKFKHSTGKRYAPLRAGRAFPNDQHFPAEFLQFRQVSAISRFIASEFVSPILDIRFWNAISAQTRMLVPKATVNKNDFPQSRKY